MVSNSNDNKPANTYRKKPVRLSRDVIVMMALNISDAEGLGALSFRRLAKELGVTPMAIYRHVSNKEDLLDAMTDYVFANLNTTTDKSNSWIEQIRTLIYELRRVLLSHRAGSELLSRRFIPSTSGLEIFEHALDILRNAGFEPQEAYLIVEQLLNQVVSLVIMENIYSQGTEEERQGWGLKMLSFYGTLPQHKYPRLIEIAPIIGGSFSTDQHFHFGINILLIGLHAMATDRLSN